MPNDVYRWEEEGGLVHHCPVCQTPLTHERCRTKCLAQHVEWCSLYHTQLFRKGWSNKCAPCRHSEDIRDKEHRKIAELLHQLKDHNVEQAPQSPKVFAARNQDPSIPSPLSKKDRKAVKKAAKIADMPKVITTADVDFVAKILDPHGSDEDALKEEEKLLLEDPDIKLNLYYHKGTSNSREVRHRHLKHKQPNGNDLDIEESDLDALMGALNAPTISQVKTEAERRRIKALRKAVQDYTVKMQKEHEHTAERKAGFWRWASRKAYDRLMANGRIWEKGEGNEAVKRKDSAVADMNGDTMPSATDDMREPSSPITIAAATIGFTSASEPRRKRTVAGGPAIGRQSVGGKAVRDDDGWTTIGKAQPVKKAMGTLKLSGNGGLLKLEAKVPGKFGALGIMAAEEED